MRKEKRTKEKYLAETRFEFVDYYAAWNPCKFFTHNLYSPTAI